MKEFAGNENFSTVLMETHNIFVAKNAEQPALRVESEPLFGGEAALFLMVSLAGLMGFLAGALDAEDLSGVGVYVGVGVLLFLVVSLFRKRKITTTFVLGKPIMIQRAGILGSFLFSSTREMAQSSIAQIVVDRFAKGYFGGYGVQLKSASGDAVLITNQNLDIDDAKKCAETVREFLALKEEILIKG